MLTLCIYALMFLLTFAAFGAAVYWLVVAHLVRRTRRELPTAREALLLPQATPGPDSPSVCIIIPAHNEREDIPALARSLVAQDYPKLHVVFCLDRCTDDTEAVIRQTVGDDPRFEIHTVSHCPPGWVGKMHAAWDAFVNSAQARKADLLLFADADTVFDPALVRAAVALLRNRDLDLVSFMSAIIIEHWFEVIVQPAAAMELFRQYPPLLTNRRRGRPFACGQFLLFRRDAYEAFGGHAHGREELLDDLFLARTVAFFGRRVGLFLSDGMLRCRMFNSWSAFRTGWKRIYIELANRKPARLRRFALSISFFNGALPGLCISASAASLWLYSSSGSLSAAICSGIAVASTIAVYAVFAYTFRVGRSPMAGFMLYPIGSLLVALILLNAASDLVHGRAVVWGGRAYPRPPRYKDSPPIHSPEAAAAGAEPNADVSRI